MILFIFVNNYFVYINSTAFIAICAFALVCAQVSVL